MSCNFTKLQLKAFTYSPKLITNAKCQNLFPLRRLIFLYSNHNNVFVPRLSLDFHRRLSFSLYFYFKSKVWLSILFNKTVIIFIQRKYFYPSLVFFVLHFISLYWNKSTKLGKMKQERFLLMWIITIHF